MKIFNVNFDTVNLTPKHLILFAETKAVTNNILKEYLAVSLIEDDNALSRVCEKIEKTEKTEKFEKIGKIGNSLKSAALEDLIFLWESLEFFEHNPVENYLSSEKHNMPFYEYQKSLESIVSSNNPEEMLNALISHYSEFGAGKTAKYIAFKWKNNKLNGVETPDDITLDRLFCLDYQKKILIENTSLFLRGLPANNALLYGDSGSGKSAIVKALLNEYYKDWLRLAEISKADLDGLPQLIDCVKNKKLKYIIFMDDLSFEENDTGYKNLKTALDGQIEKQPQNILLYATSNRFHLVNETWNDRQGEDIRVRDTANEKLSLSERFGIRVSFASSKISEEYFEIIAGILAGENIPFTEEIKKKAVIWEHSHNKRSGRTAEQFARTVIADRRGL